MMGGPTHNVLPAFRPLPNSLSIMATPMTDHFERLPTIKPFGSIFPVDRAEFISKENSITS